VFLLVVNKNTLIVGVFRCYNSLIMFGFNIEEWHYLSQLVEGLVQHLSSQIHVVCGWHFLK